MVGASACTLLGPLLELLQLLKPFQDKNLCGCTALKWLVFTLNRGFSPMGFITTTFEIALQKRQATAAKDGA